MDVQDPYLVPLEDPTRTGPSKEEQAALDASDPYLAPLKDPKRTELSDEEQAALTEKGIEKLRKQGVSEAVLWSLQAPGGGWMDLAVNVGVPMAGSIGGGVLGGLAAAPTGPGAFGGAAAGAAAGGASFGGLADYWTQLREYAREGGGDEDFKLKKGRLGASAVLGGIVPAPVKALRPVVDLPSRTVLKNIPNPNAARDVLGSTGVQGIQRKLAESLPGEFAQDAANYAMTRGLQGAVMAGGANVAEQVIDRPSNEDFSFKELGRAAAFGTLAGGAFGVLEKSAPMLWAKIRGKSPKEAVAILQAEPRSPLIDDALAAAREIEQRAVTTVKPAAQVDLENAMAAQRSAEILEQNMPPQSVSPPGGGMEAQRYPSGPSNLGLARAEEFGPVIAESEEALRRQASPIGGRNAEFAAQAFEDQAAVQSVAQGDLERAIAARQGAAPEQIPDPARVQAEAFARELPPVEPPSNIELSAQAQQMQDADGWADGVIRRAFKGGRVSSNAFLDPELAAAVAVKGAQLLAKGTKDYDNWGGLLSKEFGEAIRPHLKDLWAKSNSDTQELFAPVRVGQLRAILEGTQTPPKFGDLDKAKKYVEDLASENRVIPKGTRVGTPKGRDVSVEAIKFHTMDELNAFAKANPKDDRSFYTTDILERTNPAIQRFAKVNYGRELTPQEIKFVHLLSAFGSGQSTPTMDTMHGLNVFDEYMRTGRATGYSEKPKPEYRVPKKGAEPEQVFVDSKTGLDTFESAGNEPKYAPLVKAKISKTYNASGLRRLNRVMEYFDDDLGATMDWLSNRHSFAEITKVIGPEDAKKLSSHEYLNKKGDSFGVFALGDNPKLGSYILNRWQELGTITKDMWVARTMSRYFNEKISDVPWKTTKEGNYKRAILDDAWDKVAKELGISPAEVQERMWALERGVYDKMGIPMGSSYTSEGVVPPRERQPFTMVGRSGVMVSPNVEDLDLPRALARFTSEAHQKFRGVAGTLAPEAKIFDAAGDWKDGAENVLAIVFNTIRSPSKLSELSAQLGTYADQKAALWWHIDPKGKDALHQIEWDKKVSLADARQSLIDAKIDNRTLIQTPEGVKALVFDPGQGELAKFLALKNHASSPTIQSAAATGQFIEGSTRPTGRRAYREVLGRIESRRNLRGQPTGGGEVGIDNLGIGQGRVRGSGSQTSEGMGQAERGSKISRSPNEYIASGIDQYTDAKGFPRVSRDTYVPVNEDVARRVAKAYDDLPEVSRTPQTIQAYKALGEEIEQQWLYAKNNLGINMEPWKKEGQPYANSREMAADVRDNKHLYFFTGGDPHPFLGAVDPQTKLSLNDKFRAVHDLFGHTAGDFQFGPRGEENAWVKHSQMFSPEAQRAMASETRGQNSWVNYGEHNYAEGKATNVPLADRPYAKQKAALLPDWANDWRGAMADKPKRGFGSSPATAGFAYNPLVTNLGGAAGGFAYGFSEDPKASPEERLANALKFAAVGGLAPSVARRAISAFATRPKTPIGPRSAQTMTLEGQKKMFEHAPDAVTTAEVIKRFPGKVISEFQNALHEITRVEEKLRGSRPDLPMGDRFSLIAGAAGKAEVAFEPLLKLRKDLLKDVEPSDLNVYLFNKRTIDRLTTQARNEAAGLDKASREVLDYEISISERLLRDQEAQLGPDKWSRLEAFSNAYQKDADDNLRLVMASGLMSQKQYDQIKADNGFYAPFKVMKHLYGREGMEGVNTSTSMGSSVPFTKAVSGITDQELKLGDMMIAAAENKLRAQVLAEKNRMMTDFASLVPLDTNGDFIRRIAPHSKAPSGWETVSYSKDGLVQNLAVTPEIAKSLKGLNPAQLGVYTGALKAMSTGLRVGATTALVAFQTFNHLRDQFRMTAMSKAGVRSIDDLVEFPLDYLTGLSSSLLKAFGYNTNLTKEYLASGAAGATMSSNLRDNPYMRAAQAGNHAPMARLLGIPVESIIDTAAKIGNVLEETTKMTGFRRLARSENLNNLTGQAQKEALERVVYEVRNYVGSPDFAKAGNIGRELNAIFMFYNARLQGQTADMRRLIGRSGGPKEAAIAASKLTLMVGVPTTYIWFMNQRPENEKDYESLSKFEKMAYLNIPRYDDNGQPFYLKNAKGQMVRQYYRAPKFDIYSQMANLVEGGLNFSKTKDPMALARAGESFLEGLSPLPISGDTLAQRAESVVSGMNPAVKTLVELGTGRNTFRHQPIVPRNLENTSPEKQYTDATPEFFKRAAAAVPQSFGPSFRSPLQLERITENLTGGALTQLMKKTPEGVDPRKSNPILSRFFSGPSVANEETWDLLDKLRTSDADQYIERDRKLKDLIKRKGSESWPTEVLNFVREDPEPNGRSILQALKDETAGTTDADRTARRLSQESRAAYANAAMDKMKTPEGKARVLRQLVDRGVVDKGTLLELEVHRRLLDKKP